MNLSTVLAFSGMRRFRVALASYGADFERWPTNDRARAEALLATSHEAKRLLDEARLLEDAVRSARDAQDRRLWGPGEQDAALARLRAGVAARIAPVPLGRLVPTWHGALLQPALAISPGAVASLRWRIATTGGLAVMAGLWIGWVETATVATPVGLLTLLQSAPIHGLGW